MKIPGSISSTNWARAALVLSAALMLGACRGGVQSAIDPAGPMARQISNLWWLMFYVMTAVFLLVLIFLLAGIYRQRGAQREDVALINSTPMLNPEPARERRITNAVIGFTIATVIILFVLLFASFVTGRNVGPPLNNDNVLNIQITGYQWWWDVKYNSQTPSEIFRTANEIHIPAGTPVLLTLTSRDVIHSFWVPNLMGKRDLIPGHDATLMMQADKVGVYRGQCSEFCGYQHAKMGLLVYVDPPEQFYAWANEQRKAAPEPANESQQHGRQVFMSAACSMCHTIRGTDAGPVAGPDLTHLASRSTIGAASLENNRGHMGGWVMDSQSIKPGNKMPPNSLNPDELQALLDYLESLK